MSRALGVLETAITALVDRAAAADIRADKAEARADRLDAQLERERLRAGRFEAEATALRQADVERRADSASSTRRTQGWLARLRSAWRAR